MSFPITAITAHAVTGSASNEGASTSSSSPIIPPTIYTNEYRRSSSEMLMNPLESFGYTLSMSSTRESRHDRRLSSDSDILPPPYTEPPAYELRQREPATLAMFLFKFGFLFPPFWIMGAFILLSPLRDPDATSHSSSFSSSSSSAALSLPSAWLPEKTEAERQHILGELRGIEVKWAWRCLAAIIVLVLLCAATGIVAWGVLRSSS